MIDMKRHLLLILVATALLGGHAAAQKRTTYSRLTEIPTNAVMLNLGGLALDYLNLSYYHTFGAQHAAGAYVGYLYHPVGDERITGYGLGLAYRYYPAGKALARFYYSPIVGVQRGEVIRAEGRDPAVGILVSGMLGWQWFPEGNFAVGLAFGGRIILGGNDEEDPVIRDAFGASPIITLDLGYGW